MLSSKATIRWIEDDYNQSALLYERALNILERALDSDHAQLAPTLSGWGKLYLDNGRFDLAEPLLQRAFFLYKTAQGPISAEVGDILTALAECLYTMGRYEKAVFQCAKQVWRFLWNEILIRVRSIQPLVPNIA